jgi:hypothetical protein
MAYTFSGFDQEGKRASLTSPTLLARARTEMNRELTHHPLRLAAVLFFIAGCTETNLKGPDSFQTYVIGIREPETFSATEIAISDDAMVIGVSIGNRHRAYVVEALSPPFGFDIRTADNDQIQKVLARHVVNDLIDDVPVSVTYCDMNKCIRVFGGNGNSSLDLAISGRKDKKMELMLYRKQFLQDASNAPLKDIPFEHTTWREWRFKHPDTDVYGGTKQAK